MGTTLLQYALLEDMNDYWMSFWKVSTSETERLERQNKTMTLKYNKPDIVAHTSYSSTWEAETGGSPWAEAQAGQQTKATSQNLRTKYNNDNNRTPLRHMQEADTISSKPLGNTYWVQN